MHEGPAALGRTGLLEAETSVWEAVPVGVAPPLRLAGAEGDEDEDGPTIVRSID